MILRRQRKIHNLELGGHPITVVEDPSMPENAWRLEGGRPARLGDVFCGDAYMGNVIAENSPLFVAPNQQNPLTPDELRQITYLGEPPCQ